MLALAGKYADGWWPTGSDRPEEFANKLAVIRRAAQGAGRDPSTITPGKMVMCLLGERDELREMIQRPMVKSLGLQLTSESFRRGGFSMDYLYRPVSYTPSRAAVDSDGRVRLVMTHEDPGFHNWLDTQRFEEGYLSFRHIGTREFPPIETAVVRLDELGALLPADTLTGTAAERGRQMHARFDAIRRRYRI